MAGLDGLLGRLWNNGVDKTIRSGLNLIGFAMRYNTDLDAWDVYADPAEAAVTETGEVRAPSYELSLELAGLPDGAPLELGMTYIFTVTLDALTSSGTRSLATWTCVAYGSEESPGPSDGELRELLGAGSAISWASATIGMALDENRRPTIVVDVNLEDAEGSWSQEANVTATVTFVKTPSPSEDF